MVSGLGLAVRGSSALIVAPGLKPAVVGTWESMLILSSLLLVPMARHAYLLFLLLPVLLIFGIRVGVYRLRRRPKQLTERSQ